MQSVAMRIGGRDAGSADGRFYEKRNPFNGELVARVPDAGPLDAAAAVGAAAAAFREWSKTPPSKRRAILWKAAELLEGRAQEIAKIITAETGGTFGWGMFNTFFAASIMREAACSTTQITGEVIPSDIPGNIAMAIRQPVGVVAAIAPWNAPMILGVRAVAMPLACGNTVVLKASEECPQTHRIIGEVLEAAGIPAGAINVLTTSREGAAATVDALISDTRVKRINFTGSTHVGKIIAEKAAKYLKPVLLELGGKAPLVVLDDADLDEAAAAANFGAFMHQGQICMSTERIVVQKQVASFFLDKLIARTTKLKVGDPTLPETQIGPMVSERAAARVLDLVKDATGRGARLVCGGERSGTLFQPTILDRVTPDMRIYREESFGPVVVLIGVNDDEEAIRAANDTDYGLAAAVFSKNIDRAYAVAERIESGICHINGPTVADEPQMPFGGVKQSGIGRFGGRAGIAEFTELRWITIQTGHRHYPI
ncbi:MAG TPA: aldehyde dehydrogenase [Xanthobacteraceae bacterium]|jgi:acyl-CoA reductase-like NAD-dependent aldehyde dehydrogenase